MSDFHLLYDLESRVPHTISGREIVTVPDGMGVCLVNEQDGNDFILGKKNLVNYLVTVVDGYADFTFKLDITTYKRYSVPDNVVQDLSYRFTFILDLDIKYTYQLNQLTVEFDLSTLGPTRKNNFTTSVNEKNGKCILYVTKHNDPTALLDKFEVDLYKLSQTKTQTFTVNSNEKTVSVWMIRKQR